MRTIKSVEYVETIRDVFYAGQLLDGDCRFPPVFVGGEGDRDAVARFEAQVRFRPQQVDLGGHDADAEYDQDGQCQLEREVEFGPPSCP